MAMTAKRFRKLRVDVRVKVLHGIAASWEELDQNTLEWFMRDSQSVDRLASRLSPFTPDAKSRLAVYPLR